MSNVPDDWGCYYLRCDCGARYHASEGGCLCDEVEPEPAEDDAAEDEEVATCPGT